MEYVALGRTNVLVSRTGLAAGSLRLQSAAEQTALIREAYDKGVNYFDFCCCGGDEHLTALAAAFHEIRQNVVLGACVTAPSGARLKVVLEGALTALNTDYIDLLQVAGLDAAPVPGGEDGVADTMAALKKAGKIRYAGLAAPFAFAPASLPGSSVFDTLRFPFNRETQGEAVQIAEVCAKKALGCLAAEPLCAPFEEIEDAFLFLRQFEQAVPLWEVRSREQLQALLALGRKYEK
ncbi:MAG: aldo/keto reductase [Spirochaetaceae bacterium]|jgi:aryl-alcohol dehydrogenase-like predicted oxidoreductase|nr:aldo/keto reductase [Spirochaetaceae bacterium]